MNAKFGRGALALITVVLTALLCISCKTLINNNGDGRPTIGLAVANQQADFFNMVRQAVQAAADKDGFRVVVADAKGDGDTQVSQIQNFITQNVAAIIYIPAGATAATVPVRDAKDAGIPIVAVDRNPAGAPADTFIATDSVAAAKELGEHVIDITNGKANIGVIQGQIGTTPELARDEGFTEALKGAPGMHEVARQASQQWAQSEGFDIATDMLQAHPDINVFFGRADALALGAASAARAANRTDIKVVGFDGDIAGLQAVAGRRTRRHDHSTDLQDRHAGREIGRQLLDKKPVPAEQLQKGDLTTGKTPTVSREHP